MTVFTEPCESLANWIDEGGGATASIVPGHTGNALQITMGTARAWTYGGTGNSIKVGFWFRTNTLALGGGLGANAVMQLRQASNNVSTICVNDNGSVSALSGGSAGSPLGITPAGMVVANTWTYIEVLVILSTNNSTPDGSLHIWVNGTQYVAVTNIITVPGIETFLSVVKVVNLEPARTMQFDEVSVDANAVAPSPPTETLVAIEGWKDPRSAWGWLGERASTADVSTDIELITTHMTYTTVDDGEIGPITVGTVATRQLAIEGYVRLDGGLMAADGTAQVRIQRTAPSAKTLWEAVVAVPHLVAGGGASTVIPFTGWDVPTGGHHTYELQVAKRIPADTTTGLRVRAPCAMAAIDHGPVT